MKRMKTVSDAFIIGFARAVITGEAAALKFAAKGLGHDFVKAIRLFLAARGKVVVIGVGKSGIIARKIASTLSSTGTPSVYIHPVESLHGDMGLIAKEDAILALSYSGETEETTRLLALLAKEGLKIVSLTNNPGSKLARCSDIILTLNVRREACPYNVVPTSSTAAMLAVGDAIAVTLMKIKGFDRSSFARLHPGGNLGKLLNLRVGGLMHKGAANPVVTAGSTVKAALAVMTRTRAGATSVVDARGRLKGFFTDGDLRRYLQSPDASLEIKIEKVMTAKPVCVTPDTMAIEAAKIISSKKIDNLPVIARGTKRPIGILDEKDLLKEGLI
ncbi:MAG: KpsF/GutQ family sugar-phosphate isomerase [Elusimicrobia bacterium]|nr:KpsF/GutQ family sugar-phosphate isomerase [Elusimicrobiota bacterium]